MKIKLNKPISTFIFLLGSSLATTANAALCGTSGNLDTLDVTFRTVASDNCGGVFSGNDSLAAVNLNTNNLLFGGTNWLYQLKDDNPGNPTNGTASFMGIDWTLSADAGKTGNWSLSILDPAPADLPVTITFLAVLKGATSWAAYLFENETFTTVGSTPGTFNIKFLNNGGNIPNISHLSIYAREGINTVVSVPEPTSILLISAGLIGLLGASRKKFKTA